ncbi:GTPase [Candidatus Vidania fulgoroideorum]
MNIPNIIWSKSRNNHLQPIINISTNLTENHAIGIIRLSFGDYNKYIKYVINRLFKKEFLYPRYSTLVNIYNKNKIIDKGLVVLFPSPNSYNGETIIEIYIHGNIKILKKIINIILRLKKIKFNISKAGEFSKRALLNNKINIINIINMYNIYKNKYISNIRKKYLYNIKSIINKLLIYIDGIVNSDKKEGKSILRIKNCIKNIIILSNKELIKKKIFISIIGKPNVGKSSLFNAFIKNKESIISSKKNTTIDTKINTLYIKGQKLYLVDTFGITKVKNKLEKIGLKKTLKIIKKSSLLLILYINNKEKTIFLKLKNKYNVLFIRNKIDKINKKKYFKDICLSIKYKFDLSYLKNKISYFLKNKKPLIIKKILNNLKKSLFYIKYDLLISKEYLKICNFCILNFLYLKKKNINQIFDKFCIGK